MELRDQLWYALCYAPEQHLLREYVDNTVYPKIVKLFLEEIERMSK